MSNVLDTEFDEFLEEGNVVTAHAKPGDRMQRLQHSTPGQGASPEELGGSSTTKPGLRITTSHTKAFITI